ncbi:MAG: sensor histidine kinase [bacterium]
MTPDVVILRYLQIVAPLRCDVEELCLLISADADLLTRWLKLLNIPADLALLNARIADLDAHERSALARAQAWSVLPVVGSARLSLEQWMSVLRAACLAQLLVDHLLPEAGKGEGDEHTNVRLRALLAISGVQLPHDPQLSALIQYRGTNPALLEDALLELRVFAVVDALEVGREFELAEQLLGVSRQTLAGLLEDSERVASELVERSGIGVHPDSESDAAQQIWLRQQISIMTEGMADCEDFSSLLLQHNLVSRCLFLQPPLLLLCVPQHSMLSVMGLPDYAIRLDSRTSMLAAAARGSRTLSIAEADDLAVVDRLLLRELNCEEAIAVPFQLAHGAGLMLVALDDDSDNELQAELYVEHLQNHIERVGESVSAVRQSAADDGQDLLEQFRAAEYNRLREIVHEANNPLSIVHNYLHILELRLQHEPEAVEQLELIGSELRRAGEVFTRARDIPLKTEVVTVPAGAVAEVELASFLEKQVELFSGYAANAGVELSSQTTGVVGSLATQVDKLTQLLNNLLKNAIEACQPGDEVCLGARAGVYRDGMVGVEIFVEDEGPGIADEVLHNLAGAKQSTKGGDHQGVGLQVAFRLAIELEGALDVRTLAGQGTTFSLFLPREPSLTAR